MLPNKQNTFDDFIAVAEKLIRAAKQRDRGGSRSTARSNGESLLVGGGPSPGARSRFPRGSVAGVPLLDMVRYPQFLIANAQVPGTGRGRSCSSRALRYSPYHRVRDTDYPGVGHDGGEPDHVRERHHGHGLTK